MEKIKFRINVFIAISVVFIMLIGAVSPSALAVNVNHVAGFDKGPSSLPVSAIKKTTLVNYDEKSLVDDYAYLACVPTAVFKNQNQLYSYPLLFYQDEYQYEDDKERTLNPRQGLDYFMEDWMSYCNGKMDQMTTINVPKDKVKQWNSKEYNIIESDSPYEIAGEIALQDWSYSDTAVIAVIESDYKQPQKETHGVEHGTLSTYDIDHRFFELQKPTIGLGATYKTFQINDDNYKYIITRISWESRVDYDLQLYDDQLGMVQAAAEGFQAPFPYSEIASSYIHNYGDWEISVSAIQKKGLSGQTGKMESMFYSAAETTGLLSSNKKTIDADVALLPGTQIDLKAASFGCRNVEIKLEWDSNADLGFTLLGPHGTEIASTISIEHAASKCLDLTDRKSTSSNENNNKAILHVDRLGECRPGENYSLCVFSLEDVESPVDFKVDYSWKQNFSKEECNGFSSASNGAVLASTLNAPLLYVSSSSLPEITKKTLYNLGVKTIYIVDLGGELKKDVKNEIQEICSIKSIYEEPREIYKKITDLTGQKDVIFTTIDPYTYWYVNERKPAGEHPKGYHVGPAAYIAAHHGSPVLIVENHPRLSQASTWVTDWWKKNAVNHLVEPSAGSMIYTSRIVYDFLEDYELGDINEENPHVDQETIITVAGMFDIGTPWDRCFTGAALPGRFWGHPVDSSYSICRNMFYPALVFENPALQGENKYINGSRSEVQKGIIKGLSARLKKPFGVNLVQTKPSQEESFENPILCTFEQYVYRYNTETSDHFNCKYQRADGIIPGITASDDQIDEGAVPGKSGAYYPDISESEVLPFYAKRAGYENVFSTNFEKITENLNRGVILWICDAHGYHTDAGKISLWDPDNPYTYEENPWRSYEPLMFKPGHTRTFLHWLPYFISEYGESAGLSENAISTLHKISSFKPINFQLFSEVGSTANPDVALINYQLIYVNQILKKLLPLGVPFDLWGTSGFALYRDRILHPIETLEQDLPFVNYHGGDGKVTISPGSGHNIVSKWYTGLDFDDNLKNLHSCGIDSSSCLPATTYLHLTWMRHGSVYQIIDPWTTTDWGGVWQQLVIKRYALGDTVGQAYERGMRASAPQYSANQWWWDVWENVELFGDPNLRPYIPSTEYSSSNYWEKEDVKPIRYDSELNINGHMPYGVTDYPHEKEPEPIISFWFMAIIIILAIVVVAITIIFKKTKKR